MEYDSKEFNDLLAIYRDEFKGTEQEWLAACNTAAMYCEPSGCKDASPAIDFFTYLSEELDNFV
jgi:uncharacterized protein CbrC (UPF0167 family)